MTEADEKERLIQSRVLCFMHQTGDGKGMRMRKDREGAALGREGDSPGTINAYGKLSEEKTACLALHFCLE